MVIFTLLGLVIPHAPHEAFLVRVLDVDQPTFGMCELLGSWQVGGTTSHPNLIHAYSHFEVFLQHPARALDPLRDGVEVGDEFLDLLRGHDVCELAYGVHALLYDQPFEIPFEHLSGNFDSGVEGGGVA